MLSPPGETHTNAATHPPLSARLVHRVVCHLPRSFLPTPNPHALAPAPTPTRPCPPRQARLVHGVVCNVGGVDGHERVSPVVQPLGGQGAAGRCGGTGRSGGLRLDKPRQQRSLFEGKGAQGDFVRGILLAESQQQQGKGVCSKEIYWRGGERGAGRPGTCGKVRRGGGTAFRGTLVCKRYLRKPLTLRHTGFACICRFRDPGTHLSGG